MDVSGPRGGERWALDDETVWRVGGVYEEKEGKDLGRSR